MILVVDDHTDTCDALRLLLERQGHRVECAHSGFGAMALVRNHKPELVILDQMMPGMSGLEVLRAIRGDARLADLPILLYTADTDPSHLAEAAQLNVVAVVTKPGWVELLSQVRRATGHNGRAPADYDEASSSRA